MPRKPTPSSPVRPARRSAPVDNFAWLKTSLSPDARRLLGQAARYANAFGSPDCSVQPEFILIAAVNSPAICCQKFVEEISALSEATGRFKPRCVEGLCYICDVPYRDISRKIQDTRPPKTFTCSPATRAILRLAARAWAMVDTTRPMPIDYVINAVLSYDESLDMLDNLLYDFELDREMLRTSFMSSSSYFDNHNITFTYEDIADYEAQVSALIGPQPEECLIPNRATRLKDIQAIEKHLRDHIIGQPAATTQVVAAIKRYMVGLKPPGKPIGVFLFAGYTGVGKTEFARQLAEVSECPILRLDMSEYVEGHTVSRLYGAPPGYVGMSEGGQLTNFVMKNPTSIIVFDELEKAHPDIFNSLLQIAEEATLTDGKGKSVNFQHTIIILTTNIGSREATYRPSGFVASDAAPTSHISDFQRAIERKFKPELLGRIGQDNIVIFDRLSPENLLAIARMELHKIDINMATQGINIQLRFAPNIAGQVLALSDTASYGARVLGKTIGRVIAAPLADFLLTEDVRPGQTILVSYNTKQGFFFTIRKNKN